MITPANERKRVLGQLCRFREHRQAGSAQKALQAGYQMRRGLVPPLFEKETEPGQAVQAALSFTHPFTCEFELDPVLDQNIKWVCEDPVENNSNRLKAFAFWEKRCDELRVSSLQELARVPDPFLRRLLRGAPDSVQPVVGKFFHVALWRELAKAGHCKDAHLVEELLKGMPIVGDVARSGRWPPLGEKSMLCQFRHC